MYSYKGVKPIPFTMDRKLWTLAAVIFAAFVVWNFLATGDQATVSASLSVSPSTAAPGDTVTWTASISSVSHGDYACISSDSYYSSRYCMPNTGGSGYCPKLCQPFPDEQSTASSEGYQAFLCASGSSADGCYYDSTNDAFRVLASSDNWGAVDFVNVTSSGSDPDGMVLYPGSSVTFKIDVEPRGTNPPTDVAVAACVEGSYSGMGTSGIGGLSSWKYVSGSWWGRDWTCYVWSRSGLSGRTTVGLTLTNGTGNPKRVYFSVAPKCWWDSSYCTYSSSGSLFVYVLIPNYEFYSDRPYALYEFVGDLSGCPSGSDFGAVYSGWSTSVTCTVPSVSSGTYEGEVYFYDYTPLWLYDRDGYVPVVYGLLEMGHATATLTVQSPATDVYLYDYGSDSGSPEQEPDDHYVEYRVKVTGGTLFDSVKIYIDGTLKATYTRSDMTCGSSHCYKDARISLSGYSDGSHTIKAELYVNGSLKDTDQKTFYYYQVGVRNVSASQVGTTNQFTVSWEVKGGWKQYRVYIDSTSCVAKDWTTDPPSDAHDWQSYGPLTLSIPSCAATSGTHTVYVQVQDESGLSATDSTTVSWTITHTYSVDLTAPVPGVKHLQTDREGLPPSTYSETMTATYDTDDPSATLRFLVGGVPVYSWTVTGSGSQSYSVSADDLSCGSVTFRAELGPSDDPSSGDYDESTVTYYCWYVDIGQPEDGSSVTFPSEDLSTIAPGSTIDVYIKDSVTPSDRTYAVYATLDGSNGSPVSCPAGYDHCFRFDVSGMSCGSSHTIQAWIDEAGETRATDAVTVTFQCSQNFIRIDSPTDGQELDYYVPIGDVNVILAVTYAGGDSVHVIVNGQEVSPSETNDCSSTVCYVLTTAEGLQLGPNEVNVVLYSGGSPVAQDSVTFSVYTWLYVPGETWDVTPPLVVLRENGSRAESCRLITDTNTYYMSYDSDESWWYFPIDETWKGKEVNFECQFHSRVVWTGSYAVQGTTSKPGAPSRITGYATLPVSKPPFPVFPDKQQVSHYIYSVYHFAGRSPTDVFKDVYISQDRLCFVPKAGEHHITYFAYNFQTWPATENDVKQILGALKQDMVKDIPVEPSGSAYCIPIQGTAVIRDQVSESVTGEYYFLVLDTAQAVAPINWSFIVVILLVLGLLAWMLAGGKLG